MDERLLAGSPREGRISRLRRWTLLPLSIGAILLQVYLPLFFESLSRLELPLLVTLYFALLRRNPVSGLLAGAAIGLAQDSLSHQPLGMFGIVKTLVGYFAASISMRFDVEHFAVRFLLAGSFFFFHQFFYWVLARALLGQQLGFDAGATLLFGLLNAAVAVLLFHFFDKLKERG
ncbi:MAG: rod shape-determining protein MreD [Acidobacteriota bacterium]